MPFKSITTMATTKSNNARNIWAKVQDFFKKAWLCVKYAFGGLFAFVAIVLLVIFIYNPLLFPIWVLLGYKEQPAEMLFKEEKEFLPELFNAPMQAFCRWQVYFFPWFMKRDFVKLYPTCFAWEDQVKLALELEIAEKHHFITKMEKEAVELLWQRCDYACNMAIIKKRKDRMDEKMLSFLLKTGELDVIKCFLSRNAPTADCVEEMINATADKYEYNHKVALECLQYTALKHGLSASLIEKVYASNVEETIKVVETVLVQRNQYQMVDRLKECNQENQFLWEQFCRQNKEIWDSAQKLMRYWMLETFYDTGHRLSEGALIHFLSAENPHREDIAKIIFANEEDLDTKSLAVIRSIPDVYTIYMQTRED